MKQRTVPGLLLVTCTLALIACSLSASFDGLSNGDAGSVEVDGSKDAESADVLVAADAADSGAADVVTPRFCSAFPAPTFCDDFDDEEPFTKRWEPVEEGMTLARDRSAFRSSPSSLAIVMPSSTAVARGYLRKSWSTPVERLRFAYDVRVAEARPAGYAELSYVWFTAPGPSQAYYLAINGSTALFGADSYPAGQDPVSKTVQLVGAQFTEWTRVSIDIQLGGVPSVTVSLNGTAAGTIALDPALYAPGAARVEPGIGFTGPGSGWRFLFDNIVVDVE